MIYADRPRKYRKYGEKWSHIWSPDTKELEQFAKDNGLKRRDAKPFLHYDVTFEELQLIKHKLQMCYRIHEIRDQWLKEGKIGPFIERYKMTFDVKKLSYSNKVFLAFGIIIAIIWISFALGVLIGISPLSWTWFPYVLTTLLIVSSVFIWLVNIL